MTENQNLSNARYCANPGCGRELTSDNPGPYCLICRDKARKGTLDSGHLKGQESEIDNKLKNYATFYGFAQDPRFLQEEQSLRRFKEHIKGEKGGRIIEITYSKDSGYTFHSQQGEMKGPIADKEEKIQLPPGTTLGYPQVCSEEGQGAVCQGVLTSGQARPTVVLKAQDGCSGLIVHWVNSS